MAFREKYLCSADPYPREDETILDGKRGSDISNGVIAVYEIISLEENK